MVSLTVIRDIDTTEGNPLKGKEPGKDFIEIDSHITIGTLENGMASGKTSVGFVFTLPDGKQVLAQTSLALVKSAFQILNTIPE